MLNILFYILKFIILVYLFLFLNLRIAFLSYSYSILKLLPMILPIILSVAVYTRFERKILASMQRRRGPNETGLYG